MEEDNMGQACSMYWDKEEKKGVLTGKSEEKRPLQKLIIRWGMILKWILTNILPITMVALSKAWVCGHSIQGTASSNPAGGMDVCLL